MSGIFLAEGKVLLKDRPEKYIGHYGYIEEKNSLWETSYTQTVLYSQLLAKIVERLMHKEFKKIDSQEASRYCRENKKFVDISLDRLDVNELMEKLKRKVSKQNKLVSGKLNIWKLKSYPSNVLAFYQSGELVGNFDLEMNEILI